VAVDLDDAAAVTGADDAGDEEIGVAGQRVEPDDFGLEIGAAAPAGLGEAKGKLVAGRGGDAVDEVGRLADADAAGDIEVIARERGACEGVEPALVGWGNQRNPASSSRP
jgi:hypothetical protein